MHMDQHTNITYRRGEHHPSIPVTDAGQGEAEQKITALSTTYSKRNWIVHLVWQSWFEFF